MNKETYLKDGERAVDLQRSNLWIIQDPGRFCFGVDAVLLSAFCEIRAGERCLDMGTGTGILPLLLSAKTDAAELVGLEIQPESADMARRSVEMNIAMQEEAAAVQDADGATAQKAARDAAEAALPPGAAAAAATTRIVAGRVRIEQGDLKEASALFGRSRFDVVTCNPPYMIGGHGIVNPADAKAIARHEVLCTLDDVAREAAAVLVPGGRLYMVHRPFRLAELMTTMSRHGLEPKRLRMVHPQVEREPNLVLIACVRGGKSGLTVEKPLILADESGETTAEVKEVYGF